MVWQMSKQCRRRTEGIERFEKYCPALDGCIQRGGPVPRVIIPAESGELNRRPGKRIGSATDAIELHRVGGKSNFVPTDKNGLAFSRSPSEVLGIVYAGGESGDYGFFPNKVNGAIK